MRTFRQHLVLAFCALSLAPGVTLAAAPAQAAPTPTPPDDATIQWWRTRQIGSGYGSCGNFEFCVWEHADAGGAGLAFNGNVVCNESLRWAGTDWENRVSSFRNHTTVTIALTDRDSNGVWYDLLRTPPGNYGNLLPSLNDRADGIAVRC